MNKEELIIRLLISLNQGNSGYVQDRVRYAIEQYDKLKVYGIVPGTSANNEGENKDV